MTKLLFYGSSVDAPEVALAFGAHTIADAEWLRTTIRDARCVASAEGEML